MTNNGTMRALNGGVLESYGTFVNNGILDLMTGTTNFHGAFINNGVVADASCLRILSIARQGNDIFLTWSLVGGRSGAVQTNSGTAAGDYTANFTDLYGPISVVGSGVCTTNYLEHRWRDQHTSPLLPRAAGAITTAISRPLSVLSVRRCRVSASFAAVGESAPNVFGVAVAINSGTGVPPVSFPRS